jgi:hypothetical protein
MANPSKKATPDLIGSIIAPHPAWIKRLEKNGKPAPADCSFSLTTLASLLLFDLKIDEGGDDASYLERAVNFLRQQPNAPGYRGPSYPLVLGTSHFPSFHGSLGEAKTLSVVFASLTVCVNIPHLPQPYSKFGDVSFDGTLYPELDLRLQKYSSLTYTESFYFFLQAVALYYIVGWITDGTEPGVQRIGRNRLGAGFWLFLMSITQEYWCSRRSGIGALFSFMQTLERRRPCLQAHYFCSSVPFEAIVRGIYRKDHHGTVQANDAKRFL